MRSAGTPVALIGAGAIGLSIASALARTGRPITVCGGSTPIDHITITEDDARERWNVDHVSDPQDIADHPTTIVAVKAHHIDAIAPWLQSVARNDSTVLVAQNGIELRERLSAHVGPAQIVPGVVYLNAERTAPGQVTLRRVGDLDLAVPDDPQSTALATELNNGRLRTSTESDWTTVAWAKLLTNITANPVTALTGRRADVMRDPAITLLAQQIMSEALIVGRAEGAALTDEHAKQAMNWLHSVPAGATTSMRQDRLAGRPLEFDALTGAVVRAAARHRIDVPVNTMVLALLSAIKPGADD